MDFSPAPSSRQCAADLAGEVTSASTSMQPQQDGTRPVRAAAAAKKRRLSETPSPSAGRPYPAADVTAAKDGCDEFTMVTSRTERRQARRERQALERLQTNVRAQSVGIFRVIFRRPVTADGQECCFKEGTLLGVFKQLQSALPDCRVSGGTTEVVVWAPSLESARRAMNITELGGDPVTAICKGLSSFKARITGVSPAFTDAEILAELSSVGVTHVRRLLGARVHNKPPVKLNRVILTFDRQPPTSVILASRVHPVVLEVDNPMLCYNCLRLGHLADKCLLPKACRRCGQTGHLAAACRGSPRCVNCKGPHAAGATECPRTAYVRERNRILMEARVLQQVRAAEPAAAIDEKLVISQPASLSDVAPRAENLAVTYATVVRGVAVEKEGKSVPTVLLPKPLPIKAACTARPRRRALGTRRPAARPRRPLSSARRKTRARSNPGGMLKRLSSVAGLLGGLSPELADAVKVIMGVLRPLVKLLPLVRHMKLQPRK